jgi:nitrogen regulatory protein PII
MDRRILMAGQDFQLVTIVTERILRDEILEMMRSLGARGFTLTDAEGEGSRGVRASDWEGRNVKIESIVSSEKASKIMKAVAETYFENYAVIAYSYPVNVFRGEKYT